MRSSVLHRLGLGLALLGLVAAITILWAERGRLAHRFVIAALSARGVPARATIERIGPDGIVARDIVLGDPAHPDLIAARADIALTWTGLTPHLAGARLLRPVLRARIDRSGRVTLGTLDRLRPPPDGTPSRLPDLDLRIIDGRVLLATPYGPLAGGLAGAGNPAGRFDGRLRLAPATLAVAGCAIPLGGGDLALGARRRVGTVAGVLDIGALACAGAAAASARAAIDVRLPDPLTRADGHVVLVLSRPGAAGGRADLARVAFDGSAGPTRVRGDLRASAKGLAYQDWSAAAAVFGGRIDFDPSTQPPMTVGHATVTHIALAQAARVRLGQATGGLSPTPLGPLESAIRAALARAASDFEVAGDVSLSPGSVRPRDLFTVRSASGAVASYRRGIGGGAVTIGGGGLPDARIAFATAPDLHGRLTLGAFAAGSARIGATELTFARAGNRIHLAGPLLLDGPLGPGRVEGLAVPAADVAITLTPGVTLTPTRCLAVAARRVIEPRYTLTDAVTTLCPGAGPALVIAPNGALAGGFMLPDFAAAGVFAQTRFTVRTGPVTVALSGSDAVPIVRAVAAQVRVLARLDSGARPLTLARLTTDARSTPGGWAFAGRIEDGALPGLRFEVRTIAGDWGLTPAGVATLSAGTARVRDLLARPRIAPLAVSGLALRYADGVATGSAALDLEGSDARLATLSGRYRPGDATGTLDIASTLAFSPALQPYRISERARGIIENVTGRTTATAHLAYANGTLGGEATVALDRLSFATAALGPVRAVSGSIHLPRLPAIVSDPATFTIGAVNPGVLVENGVAQVQLLSATQIRVERLRFPFAGGHLALAPVTLDTALPERRFTLGVRGLDLAQFLQRLDIKNLDASGIFDGQLPLVLSKSGSRIEGGLLTARADGGRLRYLGSFGDNLPAGAKLAFGALRSLRYRTLTLGLNGDLDGDLVTDIRLLGENEAPVKTGKRVPSLAPGVPFRFTVSVRAPFRRLLGTASSLGDATPFIDAARQADAAAPTPVPAPPPAARPPGAR